MRTIVHLSDLHFGHVDEGTMQPLVRQIQALRPDVLVISGDLTQRARTSQFKEARGFLDALPQPQIVVPGNHDVPAYNLLKRFLEPLGGFRRYITEDLLPRYIDEEVAVCGLNSTRSFTTQHGRLRDSDIAQVKATLLPLPARVTRIVVCHHPFDLPTGHHPRGLIRKAKRAIRAFAESRVDIILSGHLHLSQTSHTNRRYQGSGHSALIVQAGTATSSRRRGEMNSFNVLRLREGNAVVERFVWSPKAETFHLLNAEEFTRAAEGWLPA